MIKNIIFGCLIGILLGSCQNYPGSDVLYEDQDMILTVYDTTATFSDYRTFAVLDKVSLITDDQNVDNAGVRNFRQKYQPNILALLKGNMLSLGFIEVPLADQPDIVVSSGVFIKEIVQVEVYDTWWDPWWGGPGWGYPGYSYSYPYTWITVDRFTVGSLLIDIVDTKNVDNSNQKISSVWSGVVFGIADDEEEEDTQRRIRFGINQCFEQSPFLINFN